MNRVIGLCLLLVASMPLCGYKEQEEEATISDAVCESIWNCEVYYPTEVIIAAQEREFELPGVVISEPFKVYEAEEVATVNPPAAEHLTRSRGVFYGPSGKETFYNLNMSRVVGYMRELGYSEEEYPYWVRDDGCKMLGDYVMVAADLGIRPKGTILETSLGTAIVVDTGSFARYDSTMLDIAVSW